MSTKENTSAVENLDIGNLQTYLAQQIPGFGGIDTFRKFAGGQSNPTFLLKSGERQYVLRRKPSGLLLKSAHAVDREYRVMKALENTNVPVPKMVALCSDESVLGSMFYVMEFVEGRILWDSTLPGLTPAQRAASYDAMVSVLAALHAVDPNRIGLGDFGRPGNYFARQVSRWTEQYRASATESNPAMEKLINWLSRHIPDDDGRVALIHGDYRIDNLIFQTTEPRIVAVLDWELSTLGHPWADIAYQCMQLRIPRGAAIPGLGDVDREVLGIPSEESYLARYCDLAGIDNIPNWNFYIVFSFFRLAAILQGVSKRALDGNASSTTALEHGALSRPLSEMAVQLI